MADKWIKQEGSNYWQPKEKGEEILGVVTEVFEQEQKDGTKVKHYTLLDKNNGEITTSSHKVLLSRMAKVKKGDVVKVVYLGEELPKVKGQNPTKMYEVFVKGD